MITRQTLNCCYWFCFSDKEKYCYNGIHQVPVLISHVFNELSSSLLKHSSALRPDMFENMNFTNRATQGFPLKHEVRVMKLGSSLCVDVYRQRVTLKGIILNSRMNHFCFVQMKHKGSAKYIV